VTEDRLEIVRSLAEAWGTSLDAHMALYAEDAVHVTAPDWPEQGTYRGREAIRGLWSYILTEYPSSTVEMDEVLPASGGRVLSCLQWRFHGPSGVPGNMRAYALWTLDGGLVSRVEYFTGRRQAFEAAGLDPGQD
jgi:ketosteroid isomerase-like protein